MPSVHQYIYTYMQQINVLLSNDWWPEKEEERDMKNESNIKKFNILPAYANFFLSMPGTVCHKPLAPLVL